MKRPTGSPCAELKDDSNKLTVLVFQTHGQFAVYWNEHGQDWWNQGPRHYKSVMGAIRAVYVKARQQY